MRRIQRLRSWSSRGALNGTSATAPANCYGKEFKSAINPPKSGKRIAMSSVAKIPMMQSAITVCSSGFKRVIKKRDHAVPTGDGRA